MSDPWKAALLKVRRALKDGDSASCAGNAEDATRGWVRGHNEAMQYALKIADDAIVAALEAEQAA